MSQLAALSVSVLVIWLAGSSVKDTSGSWNFTSSRIEAMRVDLNVRSTLLVISAATTVFVALKSPMSSATVFVLGDAVATTYAIVRMFLSARKLRHDKMESDVRAVMES